MIAVPRESVHSVMWQIHEQIHRQSHEQIHEPKVGGSGLRNTKRIQGKTEDPEKQSVMHTPQFRKKILPKTLTPETASQTPANTQISLRIIIEIPTQAVLFIWALSQLFTV